MTYLISCFSVAVFTCVFLGIVLIITDIIIPKIWRRIKRRRDWQ